jgi:hypothetical protein
MNNLHAGNRHYLRHNFSSLICYMILSQDYLPYGFLQIIFISLKHTSNLLHAAASYFHSNEFQFSIYAISLAVLFKTGKLTFSIYHCFGAVGSALRPSSHCALGRSSKIRCAFARQFVL